MKGFMKNRGMRIAVPFIVFMPVIMFMVFGSVMWAMQTVENPSPMLNMIKGMAAMEEQPEQPFSTMHLWFLFNLTLFCLTLAAISKTGLFSHTWLTKLLEPKLLLTVVPLVIVPSLMTHMAPHPAAEKLYPELWSFGFYGVFFFLGAVLYKNLDILDKYQRYVTPLAIISVVLYYFAYQGFTKELTLMQAMQMQAGMEFSVEHLVTSVLSAYIAVYMTIVCMLLGKRFLSGNSKVMRYVADSSYWVYIIHLPIIFIVQFMLLDVQWGLWTEFFVSTFVTIAIAMLTYAAFVRWTPIGILLNGRRVPLRKRTETKRWDEVSAS